MSKPRAALYSGSDGADSRWLVSAVARFFRPGTKADCCLILEGPQGIRKSTALRTLAGEYFTDELADLGSKDAAMQPRYHFVFDSGAILQRSAAEAERQFSVTGRVSESLANYGSENFDQMRADGISGRFQAAFEEGRALDGSLWKPWAEFSTGNLWADTDGLRDSEGKHRPRRGRKVAASIPPADPAPRFGQSLPGRNPEVVRRLNDRSL